MSSNDVKKTIEEAQEIELPKPEPFKRNLPPEIPYPIESLGITLGGAAKALHENIKAPLAICAQCILGSASVAVQGHVNVKIDGRFIPVSCFLLTVGESGERKSAVDRVALAPIKDHQIKLQKEYGPIWNEYKDNLEVWEMERETIRKQTKVKASDKKLAFKELGPAPREPILPVMLTEEPTYEGLVINFEKGLPTIGLFSDEGGRMFGGHAMNKDNQTKTVAGLSSLWDGSQITRMRKEGSTHLTGRRLSLHLMMQGVVAHSVFTNSIFIGQGFTSRCLTVWPDSTAGTRFYNENDLNAEPRIQNFNTVLTSILNKDLPFTEGLDNALSPSSMELTKSSKALWIQAHNQIELQLAPGGDYVDIRSLASKAAEHILRLAAILAYIEAPGTLTIEEKHIESGKNMMLFYLAEAIRIQSVTKPDPIITLAEKVLAWLRKGNKTTVTLKEIYQCGPSGIRDVKTAKKVCTLLEEHNYFTPHSTESAAFLFNNQN